MDVQRNGQNSRSPQPGGSSGASPAAAATGLILPEWDRVPEKHLHASLDLISLLHLDGLYNQFVRPFFDPIVETDDEGDGAAGVGGEGVDGAAGAPVKPGVGRAPKPKKKQGLTKGYVGLLEDCIDPTPMGTQAEHSLLTLVGEYLDPPRPPNHLSQGPIEILSREAFASARLEVGLKTEGYEGGEKRGVREAEEKRKKKKLARMSSASVQPELPDIAMSAPSPGRPAAPIAPPNRGPATPNFVPRNRAGTAATSTPSRPTPGGSAVRPPWPRGSAPPGMGGRYMPNSGSPRPGTPGTPVPRGIRLTDSPIRPPHPTHRNSDTPGTPGVKRPGDASGAYPPGSFKRSRPLGNPGSRSASPALGGNNEVGVKAVFKGAAMRRADES